jgi:hypothetical protein
MDKQDPARSAETKRPTQSTKDLEPNEPEIEQVKGGSLNFRGTSGLAAQLSGGGGAGREL